MKWLQIFEISFSSFYGKKKVNNVVPVAIPVDGNESDIGDAGDESDGSIESETEEEVIESATDEDTEESDSSEEDEAMEITTNGTKPKAKTKGKKANLPWSKGEWTLPKESSFDEVPLQLNDPGNFSPNSSPINFFELFCNDAFFQCGSIKLVQYTAFHRRISSCCPFKWKKA